MVLICCPHGKIPNSVVYARFFFVAYCFHPSCQILGNVFMSLSTYLVVGRALGALLVLWTVPIVSHLLLLCLLKVHSLFTNSFPKFQGTNET